MSEAPAAAMHCATHRDRPAVGQCAGCGQPLCGKCCKGETKGISAELIHYLQGINHVSLGLAHLFSFRIPDQGMDINIPERHIIHKMETHHHHPGHPEKKDVKTRDKGRGRIKCL